MHTSSYEHMADLVQRYLCRAEPLQIVDIGSYDVNGSYRPLFNQAKWVYTGVDLAAGPNVDLVLTSPYHLPLASGSADLIVSGQCFEHVDFFWLAWLDMVRVLKPGGQIFLIAPSRGPEHRYPVDCWRFYPDGYRALAKYGDLKLLEVSTDWTPHAHEDSAAWGDTVGVFRKPAVGRWHGVKQKLRYAAGRILLPVKLFAVLTNRLHKVGHDKASPAQAQVLTGQVMEESLDAPLHHVLPLIQARIMNNTTYFGVPALKNPLDFWVYQELIVQQQPDVIIEIGNRYGGSTLALAHFLDLLGNGRLIGVDISHELVAECVRIHPRITLLEGDACQVFQQVARLLKGQERLLIIEDSSHTYENTLAVLRTYSPLLKPGNYFIVEDGICYHGLDVGPKPGPYEAIETFVAENAAFVIDRSKEDFLITWNPKGFLRRVA